MKTTLFSLSFALLAGVALLQSCGKEDTKVDITAPSITTQPANQGVTVGATAIFSVVATGTGPLAYQWKKNGTNIDGATAASYTTPAATLTDNNANYTVVVTNAKSSVTSAAAVLTVNKLAASLTMPSALTLNIYLNASGFVNAATLTGVSGQPAPTGAATYLSSATDVAMVDSNGKITPASGAANNATATITASYDGDSNYLAATAATTVTITTDRYALVANASGGTYDKTECVKDHTTGLIWEGKPAGGTRGSPALNTSGTYTNYDSWAPSNRQKSRTEDASQGDVESGENSIGYRNAVNDERLCGFNDWRLPTIVELRAIFDASVASTPKIDAAWFPNTFDSPGYWTSDSGNPRSAKVVSFREAPDDATHWGLRNEKALVRLVRK